MRRVVLLAVLGLAAQACTFSPDLTRYPPCDDANRCPAGYLCLVSERRCLPECGEAPECASAPDGGDAGTATDAGPQPLELDGGALPPAIEQVAYAFTFSPRGGTPPYLFSPPSSSNLPAQLSVSSAGSLTGTPPGPGSFAFDLQVTDSATPSQRVTGHFELTVQPLLRIATQSPLPDGVSGQAYAESFSATGGVPPYAYALDGGSLPPGLTLGSAGTLSGTPSQVGTSAFSVVVRDASQPPQESSRSYTLEVKALSSTLAIATRSFADGRSGTAYSQRLQATGGTTPYTWQVIGALPPGLALTDNTTVGAISGTPSVAGTYDVTVQVSDALISSQQRTFTLEVY